MKLKIMRIILNKLWKVLVCSKRMYSTQRQILGLFVVCTLSLSFSLYFMINKEYPESTLVDATKLVQNILKEKILAEKGTGCNMPELDPFSADIMIFEEKLPKVTCEGTDWVECYKSECYVKKEILKNMKDISCIYKDIIYVDDKLYFVADATKIYGDEKYMLNRSDHVKVSCTGTDLNSLSIVSSRWYGYKAGFRPVQTQPIPSHRRDSFNVLMLGFDSTSRNGFMRKLPESYKYLVENAVILNSYNIVGDGTPAALYPILTGLAEEEQRSDARKKMGSNKYVDARMFIFDLVKRYGYRTAYFEDMPWVGSFQYRYNGFRRQPADHYLRAFFLEETKSGIRALKSYPARHCVGAIPQYQLMMNLTDEFLQLDSKKFCFTFIADISHDNFNVLATADEDLLWILQSITAKGALEDTLVIIFGDHGSRFSKFRETYQGKLEERLPLMAIMLPEKLKALRPDALEALKHNQDVLTTPFDIHTTLLDVLDLKDQSNKYKIPGSDLPRAISLLEPGANLRAIISLTDSALRSRSMTASVLTLLQIPKSRSCAEAGIMTHWCACTKWFNVSRSNPIYGQVVNVLSEYINSISQEQRSKCARRTLRSIDWVLQKDVDTQLLKYGNYNDLDKFVGNPKNPAPRSSKEYYQAKIVMRPGRAVFEGTLVYFPFADTFSISQKDISRVSAYRDEPSCVSKTHPHLNKYCYCKDHLLKRRPL